MLFLGTKRQAQEAIKEEAERCGMFYVNHRWLGGTLTNWVTLQKSIKRLKMLKAMSEDGRMAQLSKKEAARLDREMKHLQQNFSGVENMTTLPDTMFVIDPNAEVIAVREARRMGIPVVAIVDTNCDPDAGRLGDSGQRRCAARHSPVHLEDFRRGARRTPVVRADADRRSKGGGRRGGRRRVDYVDTSAYEAIREAGRRLRRG